VITKIGQNGFLLMIVHVNNRRHGCHEKYENSTRATNYSYFNKTCRC